LFIQRESKKSENEILELAAQAKPNFAPYLFENHPQPKTSPNRPPKG